MAASAIARTVNSSRYASLFRVPVAALGAAAYATVLAAAVAAWLRRDLGPLTVGWAVAAASVAFSAYLTYIELHVLHAICVYCVASAAVMMSLFVLLTALTAQWLIQADSRHPSRAGWGQRLPPELRNYQRETAVARRARGAGSVIRRPAA